MSKKVIFYSWQSDSDNRYNRNFIENSLKKAIKEINREDLDFEFIIDRDTRNIPGMPSIENTIIEKINLTDIFIADISLINTESVELRDERPVSNPNVLFELGYAMGKLGPESIIGIFNNCSGSVEQLPFDIRQKRVLQYTLSGDSDTKTIKDNFVKILKKAILQCSGEKEEIAIKKNSQVFHLLADIWITLTEIDLVRNNPSLKKIIGQITSDTEEYRSYALEINNDRATIAFWSSMYKNLKSIDVIENYDQHWELIMEKADGALLFCNSLFDKFDFRYDPADKEKSIIELKNIPKELSDIKEKEISFTEKINLVGKTSNSMRKMTKYNLFPEFPDFQKNIENISYEARKAFFNCSEVSEEDMNSIIDDLIEKVTVFFGEQ